MCPTSNLHIDFLHVHINTYDEIVFVCMQISIFLAK